MTAAPDVLDSARLRSAFGMFPSGLVAVAAMVDGLPVGLTASSFVAVSLDPPLIAFCIQHTSSTWPRLATAERIGVSVLGGRHESVARSLAGPSAQRFDGVDYEASSAGAVFIADTAAAFDTSLHRQVTAGDHDIVLLAVHALDTRPDIDPMVFHRSGFRGLEAVRP